MKRSELFKLRELIERASAMLFVLEPGVYGWDEV